MNNPNDRCAHEDCNDCEEYSSFRCVVCGADFCGEHAAKHKHEPDPDAERGEEMGTTGEEDEESKGPAFYFASLAEAREVLGNALYPGLNGDSPPGTANSLWAFAHEAARRLTLAPAQSDPDAAVRADGDIVKLCQELTLGSYGSVLAGLSRAFAAGRDKGARDERKACLELARAHADDKFDSVADAIARRNQVPK